MYWVGVRSGQIDPQHRSGINLEKFLFNKEIEGFNRVLKRCLSRLGFIGYLSLYNNLMTGLCGGYKRDVVFGVLRVLQWRQREM